MGSRVNQSFLTVWLASRGSPFVTLVGEMLHGASTCTPSAPASATRDRDEVLLPRVLAPHSTPSACLPPPTHPPTPSGPRVRCPDSRGAPRRSSDTMHAQTLPSIKSLYRSSEVVGTRPRVQALSSALIVISLTLSLLVMGNFPKDSVLNKGTHASDFKDGIQAIPLPGSKIPGHSAIYKSAKYPGK